MTYQDFRDLCEQRRSVRYFDSKPVSREDVQSLLELARLAPNVENVQPWEFHVIANKELRKKLMESSCYGNFVEGAGVFIVAVCDTSAAPRSHETMWNPRELEYSCVTAMEHMMLGATAMGLGSCWVSLHHGKPHELLHLKPEEIVVGGLMFGYLKHGEEKPTGGHDRKPLAEIAVFHD